MKILYFYQYFTTPKGAWSTRVYEFASRWVSQGDSVTVVTSIYDKSNLHTDKLIDKICVNGIDVIVLNVRLSNKDGVLKRLYGFAAYAILASWYALRVPADVTVASSGPITVGIPGLVARYVRRIPLIFEVRDLWPEGAIQLGFLRRPAFIRLARWFERVCYRSATTSVACSPGQAAWVLGVHADATVEVIPNAADISVVETVGGLSSLPDWAQNKRLVLYGGTLGLIDDCSQIVYAAKTMQDRGRDDVFFVIIGDGKERSELEERARELSLTNLRFLGLRSKEEVMQWLQEAVCTLLVVKNVPFLDTASPNKLFDSFAAGIPVVQTTQGWIKELLAEEDCGVTVPSEDPHAMADAILRLIEDPVLQRKMARNARRLGEEKFERGMLANEMRTVMLRAAGIKESSKR